MRFLGLGVLLILLGLTRVAAVSSPTEIPSPRPQGWVTDQARLLPPDTITDLNRLLDTVHQHDGAEMAVVTVDTINGADPRRFATDLFNRWGIGDPTRNNGLLLFVALRDRKAEIILGRGIQSAAHVARSDRIMRDIIVPHFRSGDSAGGLAAGARECAAQFFGTSVAQPVEAAASPAPLGPSRHAVPAPAIERPASARPPVAAAPWLASPGQIFALLLLLLFGILGGGALVWLLIHTARNTRRGCPNCRTPMTKLDEMRDDAQLSPTERAEEKVGSVNYDVWLCPSCLRAEKVRHTRWFTNYSSCPRCGAKTRNSVKRTRTAATTASTGLVEIHEFCACCNDTRVTTRVLPMIVESSSSHDSSSGFSGGSSSGSGSSGSW